MTSDSEKRDVTALPLLEEFAVAADWYRRCLEDVIDRRVVCGLDEARHGYDAAFDKVQAHLREAGAWTAT